MPIRIGQRPDHGFDKPLGLLSDCHRRIERFLHVLIAIADQGNGGPLTSAHRSQLDNALTYFATAAPRHTADEEESVFPRLRASRDAAARSALDRIAALEVDHVRAQEHHAEIDRIVRQWMTDGWLKASDVSGLSAHLSLLQRYISGTSASRIASSSSSLTVSCRKMIFARSASRWRRGDAYDWVMAADETSCDDHS